LNIFENGNALKEKFIEECQKRPSRFEEPIKKTKIQNFATEAIVKKNKSKAA